MPCAFRRKRPKPLDKRSGCQFGEHEANLQEFNGKSWCQFHLPYNAKKDWSDRQNADLNHRLESLLKRQARQNYPFDLSGVITLLPLLLHQIDRMGELAIICVSGEFRGGVDFGVVKYHHGMHFHQTKFYGPVKWEGGGQVHDAVFTKCLFYSDVNCEELQFTDKANFSNSKFKGQVIFSKTKWTEAIFEEVEFNGPVSFSEAEASESISFIKSRFEMIAQFENIKIDGNSKFSSVEFMGPVSFANAEIPSTMSARSGERETHFNDAIFQDEAVFSHTSFAGTVRFLRAVFSQEADFFNSQMMGHSVFREVTFKGASNFNNAYFSKNGNFIEANFEGDASFDNARFGDILNFKEAKFEGNASFNTEMIGANTPTSDQGGSFKIVWFSRVRFGGTAIFSNRIFQNETSFYGTTFTLAPKFHGCRLYQDTDFSGTNFIERNSYSALLAYRTLKLFMGDAKARDDEARFNALEQETRRNLPDTPVSVKTLSWLYEVASNYGQSAIRPVSWFFAINLAFLALYFFYPMCLGIDDPASSGQIISFMVRQIVRPFTVFWPDSETNIWIAFAASIQSIFSLSLIGLFILAVRWRFRRG